MLFHKGSMQSALPEPVAWISSKSSTIQSMAWASMESFEGGEVLNLLAWGLMRVHKLHVSKSKQEC